MDNQYCRLTYIQIACVERMKQQIKGPIIQSTLKRKIGYSGDSKGSRTKLSTGNTDDMDTSAIGRLAS
jgi:hypothetical protein